MHPTISPDVIKTLSLFSGLAESEREALLKGGRFQKHARGHMVFAQGDAVTQFYVIITGTVQAFRATPDGHEKTIEILKSGQTMCEGEIMDSCRTHRANAVAVEESLVLEFPVAWLKQAAKSNTTFALNLLSMIANHAHLAEVEAEHQATMSAAQLVACFLQRLCVLYDLDPKGFDLPYSKTLIASRLGMELETFSRTLAKLKEQGIVVEGTRVEIRDLEKIAEYVCGVCSMSGDCPTHDAMEKRVSGMSHKEYKSH